MDDSIGEDTVHKMHADQKCITTEESIGMLGMDASTGDCKKEENVTRVDNKPTMFVKTPGDDSIVTYPRNSRSKSQHRGEAWEVMVPSAPVSKPVKPLLTRTTSASRLKPSLSLEEKMARVEARRREETERRRQIAIKTRPKLVPRKLEDESVAASHLKPTSTPDDRLATEGQTETDMRKSASASMIDTNSSIGIKPNPSAPDVTCSTPVTSTCLNVSQWTTQTQSHNTAPQVEHMGSFCGLLHQKKPKSATVKHGPGLYTRLFKRSWRKTAPMASSEEME